LRLSDYSASRPAPPRENPGAPVALHGRMKTFLHVGCGPQTQADIQQGFHTNEWHEVRFDIDPNVKPDIVGAMTDLSLIATGSMDALYSSHNIEHVFAHEVPIALQEFHRVLKPEGFVVITCPDIQAVCEAVAQDKLLEPLYVSASGPIAPIDILYGHRASVARGNPHMAHKCGFTYSTLMRAFLDAGFASIIGARRPAAFDLWLMAHKAPRSAKFLQEAGPVYLPLAAC
jgi:SAM-dependent methyltransferase